VGWAGKDEKMADKVKQKILVKKHEKSVDP